MYCVSLFFLFLQLSTSWLPTAHSLGIKSHRTYHFRHTFNQGPIPLRVVSETSEPSDHIQFTEAGAGRPTLLRYLDDTKRTLVPFEQFYAEISQLFPFESSGLMADILKLLSATLQSVNPSFLPVDFRVCQTSASLSSSLTEYSVFISVGLLRVYELLLTRIGTDGKPLPDHANSPLYLNYSWTAFKEKYPRCYRANSFPGFPSLGKLRSEWLYRLNFKTLTASVKSNYDSPTPSGLLSPSPLAATLYSMALPNPFAGSSLESLLHRVVSEPEGWEYKDGALVILGVADTPLLRIKWTSRHQECYYDALVYNIADSLGYGEFYSRTIEFTVSPSIDRHYYSEEHADCIGLLSEYISLFPSSIPTPSVGHKSSNPIPPRALAFAYILSRSGFGNTWNAMAYVTGLVSADQLYRSSGLDKSSRIGQFYGSDNYHSLPTVDELDLVMDYYHRIPAKAFEALLISGAPLRGHDNHDGNFVLTYLHSSDTFTMINVDYDKYLCNYYPNPIMNTCLSPDHTYTIPMHPHARQGLQNVTETIERLGRQNAFEIARLTRNFVLSRERSIPSMTLPENMDTVEWNNLYQRSSISSSSSKLMFITEHFCTFLAIMIAQLSTISSITPTQTSLLHLDVLFYRSLKFDNSAIFYHAVPPFWRWSLLIAFSFGSAALLRALYRYILPSFLIGFSIAVALCAGLVPLLLEHL